MRAVSIEGIRQVFLVRATRFLLIWSDNGAKGQATAVDPHIVYRWRGFVSFGGFDLNVLARLEGLEMWLFPAVSVTEILLV